VIKEESLSETIIQLSISGHLEAWAKTNRIIKRFTVIPNDDYDK